MDDTGPVLDAEYTCQNDGMRLELVLASAGGGSGSRPARDPDYLPALGVLLARLRDRGAVIVSAVVDSTETRRRHLPESDRRLLDAPVGLASLASTDDVLRQLTTRQAAIGQAPGTKGATVAGALSSRSTFPDSGRTRLTSSRRSSPGRLAGNHRHSCSPGTLTNGTGRPSSSHRRFRSPAAAKSGPKRGAPETAPAGSARVITHSSCASTATAESSPAELSSPVYTKTLIGTAPADQPATRRSPGRRSSSQKTGWPLRS